MLKLENITKTYVSGDNKVEALKGISVDFRKCEFVAILGQSGCGKTTMLNIIGGLDRYTKGELTIKGKSTKKFKDRDWDTYRNHSVGFVFQSYNLISHQTVLSNVELALTLSGVSKRERRRRAKEVLQKVGLEEQINKRPNQLSGGQMQRVAIARALINNPEILLADEPTGALDSATSIQIMELLKEIAEDRLVIMVTHNPDLADKYATRTIKLLDGKIIDDSNPYKEEGETYEEVNKGKKTHMSFFTALGLSLNNLMTKKGRTILTAFAGSIGIIGIALILSLSNGVQKYIDKVQEDTLSTYPITIQEKTIDMNTMLAELAGQNDEKNIENRDENKIYVDNIMSGILSIFSKEVQENNLVDFKKFIEADNSKIKEYSNAIQFNYNLNLNIYRKLDDDSYLQVNPNQLLNNVGLGKMIEAQNDNPFMMMDSSMTVSQYDVWSEMLDNKELLESQYDVLAGRWPQKYNEVILILGKDNEISEYTLYSLGIKDQQEAVNRMLKFQNGEEVDKVEEEEYEFSDFLNLKFKLLLNMDYFQKSNGIWINKSNDKEYITNKLEDSEDITVVGIIRPKAEAVATSITGSIGYTSDLKKNVINRVNESDIAKEQKENPEINIFTGTEFKEISNFNNTSFDYSSLTNEQKAYLQTLSQEELAEYMTTLTQNNNATYESNLQTIGVVDLDSPSAINIYPKDFDSKDMIADVIEQYNTDKRNEGKEEDVISYTDIVGVMMNSVSTIINVISYILIAFVAISLVVSSIMIGIITYISVLERIKEIGILRSIGASKKDISRVFNAETFIIGISAGAIGIGVTLLLILPINAIINSLAEIKNAARLPLNGGIALVIISVLLTMIAGIIPARLAAKKDPVEALRTE